MRILKAGGVAMLVLVPGLALGQAVQAPPTVGAVKSGESACFQKAGVPDSVWERVHAIRQNDDRQVTTICQNAGLTPDQRRQQITQVHAQARRQIDALLTPQQLAGIEPCRAEKRMAKAGGGGRGDVCARGKAQ
jgi:Spy/CpxP family protein refolding chaperone